MTLSWIGQKIIEVGDVIKLKVFGLQVELKEHQAQILEPRGTGRGVCMCATHREVRVRSYSKSQIVVWFM